MKKADSLHSIRVDKDKTRLVFVPLWNDVGNEVRISCEDGGVSVSWFVPTAGVSSLIETSETIIPEVYNAAPMNIKTHLPIYYRLENEQLARGNHFISVRIYISCGSQSVLLDQRLVMC